MPLTLRSLDSFGAIAAEDDAVLNYFLTTEAIEKIKSNAAFVVLARKGAGKTAIVRHFCEGTPNPTSKGVSLKQYPWNVHAARADKGASPIEAYVATWRYLIAVELAQLAVRLVKYPDDPDVSQLRKFLQENYGSTEVDLTVLLRPSSLKFSKLSIEPQILGNKLFSLSFEKSATNLQFGMELEAVTVAILGKVKTLINVFQIRHLLLHFDELDQGLLSLDEGRRRMLIGLILAARSIRQDCKSFGAIINPVVYLRSDLWEELDFSDKNKITQTNSLHLEWGKQSLLDLVNARLRAKLSPDFNWLTICTPDLLRGGQTKWNNILGRSFLRPRDVISFLNVALTEAKKRNEEPLLLNNKDILAARDAYSNYLKQELDDEILPHWKQWDEALKACSALATITFGRDQFDAEYEKRKSQENPMDSHAALSMLYRFSVIGYERRHGLGGSSWVFEYTDPQAGWDNTAKRLKVHQGLKEYAKLKEERAQTVMEDEE